MAARIQKEGLKLELVNTVLAAETSMPSSFDASSWQFRSTLQYKQLPHSFIVAYIVVCVLALSGCLYLG